MKLADGVDYQLNRWTAGICIHCMHAACFSASNRWNRPPQSHLPLSSSRIPVSKFKLLKAVNAPQNPDKRKKLSTKVKKFPSHSMAATPAILPVSTAQPPPPSDTNVANPAANPSAFRSFLLRISDSSRLALAQRRSWAELLDRSSFSRPTSLSEATSRLRKNVPYYRINYLILIASVLALSLVSHPGSLLLLLLLAASWIFLYFFRPSDASPISLFGRTFSDREIFGGLVVLTIFVVFLTSVGSLIISAIMLGAGLVAVHGSFHVPEDLFLDDQESGANVGFLSFLGGVVPPASATQPVVAGL